MAEDESALSFAADHLRGDREVVMTAVANWGDALAFAADHLRGDREVVMTAVAQNGYALRYATEELREDKEIMKAALATADGDRPIGLKARPKPTCLLTKFGLCYQISLVCLRRRKGPSSVWHVFFFFVRFCFVIVCPMFFSIRADLETVPSF